MFIRKALIAFASAALVAIGITATATPAQAQEVLNCTVGGNTVQLAGTGPWDFENEPNYTCQEVTVASSTVALTDIEILADTNGDGTFDSDISVVARAGYANAQTGVQITYTGSSFSGLIVAEFKKNITGTPSQRFEITPVAPVAAPTITGVSPSSGPEAGGTSVTITGTNLSNATSVTFGGVGATVTSNTATEIVATTPPGTAGPRVNVSVTTGGGTATAVNGFGYVAAPTITGVSPSSGPEAGGTSVTITGTDLSSPTSVTFGGVQAAVTAFSPTQLEVTTPTGSAGTVEVSVTTMGGTVTETNAFTYTAPAPDPTPATPPSAPVIGELQAGDGEATISWNPPESQGSFPVTNYQVQTTPSSAGCLVASPQTQCTIAGLTDGTSYSFRVRALNGGGWGPWLDAGSVTPNPVVGPTILISGTRGDVRGKPGVIVTGTTTGMDTGSVLHPWVRMPGMDQPVQGRALISVDSDGGFTWQRRANRDIEVQIRSADGAVRSQEITIRGR